MPGDLHHFPPAGQDPYAAYARMRDADPLYWSSRLGMWVVTRYADVEAILSTPSRFSVDRFRHIGEDFLRRRPDMADAAEVLRDWAVYRDPPDHTRLRALLTHSFARRQIETLQASIQHIVDDLLDQLAGNRTADFLQEFAFPLPATVIALMLGVPTDDLGHLKAWSVQIAAYIGGARGGDDVERAKQGLLHTCDYFRTLLRARRGRTGDDLLGLLLSAEEQGATLSEDEVVSNCVLILFAGHETTTNLLTNALFRLLDHPAQLALLRARPELVASAVEESLRYDPPVAGTLRIATEDVALHGRAIQRGQMVAAMIDAANRDPAAFERPGELDVTRAPNRHLTFGPGIHFCLGASLARLEARIALATILRRFPQLRLAETPRWKPHLFFRGLESLRVELEA